MSTVTALVLAGARAGENDPVAKAAGVSCKAFADIGGKPMVERVIQSLLGSDAVKHIRISLPGNLPVEKEAPDLAHALAHGIVARINPASSPVRSIIAAIADTEISWPLLITTADHALLTPEMVRTVVNQFDARLFDAGTGIVPLELVTRAYPQLRRTKLKFRDGGCKGANLFIFANRDAALRILNFWQGIESKRKKPVQMAFALGIPSLLQYASGFMTLAGAFTRLGKLTGTRLQPILLSDPKAALDVDTVQDLAFIQTQI